MANANIFQQYLQPPRSVVDYANDYAKVDQLRNANAMQALTLQQAGDVQNQRNALRALVQGGQADLTTPAGQAQAISIAPDVAPAMVKSVQEGITSGAAARKDTAQAGNFDAESGATNVKTRITKANQAISDITNLSSPDEALASIQQHLKNGDIDMTKASALVNGLQPALQDPTKFSGWQRQMVMGIMDAKDRIAATAPKVEMANAGGSLVPVNVNADAGTVGAIPGAPTIAKTVSPDTVATQAGENSRAAAQRATQLQVAGMGPNGTLSPALEAEAQMVAAGKAAPPSGMAATRPAAAMLMQRVAQLNPDYDATTYGAKVKAAKDFTSGPLGNQMRSFQVANDHLDQLLTMSQALKNGNYQLVNQIGNAYGVATGQAPAAVFDAVRHLVGPEVVNAITAGGGSAGEREEAANTFNSKSSPEQFAGTISATRDLMKAKYSAMVAQRKAAGLSDSTLPSYSGAHTAPAAATPGAGWQYLGTTGGGQ